MCDSSVGASGLPKVQSHPLHFSPDQVPFHVFISRAAGLEGDISRIKMPVPVGTLGWPHPRQEFLVKSLSLSVPVLSSGNKS